MANGIESFQTTVMRYLLGVLDEHGRSFLSILTESQNCDPAFLLNVLHEMEARKLVYVNTEGPEKVYSLTSRVGVPPHTHRKPPAATWFETERDSGHSILKSNYFGDLVNAVSDSLPEPGLVYSQWWFSEPTYARLTGLLHHLVNKQNRVAFFGASTLGAVFSHCDDSPTTIIDVDEVLLKRVGSTVDGAAQLVCRDIWEPLDSSLQGKFDVVFADPPWSGSSLKTFFVRTSEMLATGGTLIISFPPVFTRPSAQTERRRLIRMAEPLGLLFTAELAGFTEYSVPSFEYRAYREHGIELSRPWRKGDVFVFKKRRKTTTHVDISAEASCKWDQYDCGTMRLFLKKNGATQEGPARIVPIAGKSDFSYGSTSSRTHLWKQARLVSTRNLIADISGTRQLSSVFRKLVTGNSWRRDDLKCLKDVLPETQTAISILFDNPLIGNSQEGESKWHCHEERNSSSS